jgi:hypothetical protein
MQRTSKGDCKAPEIVHGEAIRGWRSVLVGSCPGSTSGVSFLRGRLSDVVRGRISLPVTGRHRYLWGRGGEIWGLGRDSSDDLVSRHQVGSTTDLGWPYQTKNPLHWFPGVPRERGYRVGVTEGKASGLVSARSSTDLFWGVVGADDFRGCSTLPDHDRC